MKLTIKRQPLEKLLESVFAAVPAQTSEPAFKNFLMTVDETGLTVLASSGDLSIQGFINQGDPSNPIINSEPGKIQVPAKYLLDIVKSLRSDIVTINLVDSSILYVSDELSQFQLNVMKAEEYPDIDISTESKEEITIAMKDFLSLYNSTAFAVATKGPKELFMGINVTIKDGKISFVATDSFRLARKYVPIASDRYASITIPVKALSVVSKVTDQEFVSLIIDAPQKVVFKIGNLTVVSKLYNGDFPNVDRIIPNETNYQLTVNSKEFIDAIGRITIVGNTKILVNASPEQTEISSKDVNVGSSKELLANAKFTGDRFSIIFNATYVIDAIKALNSENVTLAFVAENRAFLVKSDDESVTQVITPIRSFD